VSLRVESVVTTRRKPRQIESHGTLVLADRPTGVTSDGGSGAVEVRRVETEPELADALAVRRTVFVEEQDVPADLEVDEFDAIDAATHFVASDGGRAIGAARLRPYECEEADDDSPAEAKVERVAVLAERRGEGIGARLMDAVEAEARAEGFDRLVLHAQITVEGFYARRGYRTVGEEFEEAGIAHVKMVHEC
jgi:predicted GNAT family N-acyltransferase